MPTAAPLRLAIALLSMAPLAAAAAPAPPTLAQLLAYPLTSTLTASPTGDRFAWIETLRGVRNIWSATPVDPTPRQLTHFTADDGQEITQLTFSPDSATLVFVRGGDHDANWDAASHAAPDPARSPEEPHVTLWAIPLTTKTVAPIALTEGDSPAISRSGQLAFLRNGEVFSLPLTTPGAKPTKLFYDRGRDDTLTWSPDGTRLAFVSNRDDHSFIGVYTSPTTPLTFLAPSTDNDGSPVWSPDSHSIAFLRFANSGPEPTNPLVDTPVPFTLYTADATTGAGHALWSSPNTMLGSLPDIAGAEPFFWTADNTLVFRAQLDSWPHLYAISATAPAGTEPRLLTPGNYMVEDVALAPDHRTFFVSANTGTTPNDDDRRHLLRVTTDGQAPTPVTTGTGLEWSPTPLANNQLALIAATAQQPPTAALLTTPSPAQKPRVLETHTNPDYPAAALLTPTLVTFPTDDGTPIQAQLFRAPNAPANQPAVLFVHGGPPRQMLLGWHYYDFYSETYAVNQALALHGFTVLSVNYRRGIGYGYNFQHPAHAGPAGAAEYADVVAAQHLLAHTPGVDPARIGIWGASYGGYLTGLALARNSDLFQAGVDIAGIYNWLPEITKYGGLPDHEYAYLNLGLPSGQPDWQQAIRVAFAASPIANVATWHSPVLLIQGDDDRNVLFRETIDLAYRLNLQHTPVETLVFPNETHSELVWTDDLRCNQATVDFLTKILHPTVSPDERK